MKAGSPTLCLNESHINPNTLISGHEDRKIRIWNTEKAEVTKELQTNKDPIRTLIVVENPFSSDSGDNFHLISFGDTKEDVFFNQPEHGKAFQLRLTSNVSFQDTSLQNPKIQLFRKSRTEAENGINLATYLNSEDA